MVEELFQIGVKALIRNKQNKFLITKGKYAKYWDLPGGRISKDEDIEYAFARELKEEIGIQNIKILGVHNAIISKIKIDVGKKSFRLFLIVYDCKLYNNVELESVETYDECKWINKGELLEALKNKYPNTFFQNL